MLVIRSSPERSAHGLVVHVGLVFVQPPEAGDGLGVHQLEDAALAVRPLDVARTRLAVLQQLEQELPQVGRVTCTQGRGRFTVSHCYNVRSRYLHKEGYS